MLCMMCWPPLHLWGCRREVGRTRVQGFQTSKDVSIFMIDAQRAMFEKAGLDIQVRIPRAAQAHAPMHIPKRFCPISRVPVGNLLHVKALDQLHF